MAKKELTENLETSTSKKKDVVILTGVVSNCESLNIRKGMSMSSDILGTLPRDAEIEVVKTKEPEWYKLVGETTGYVNANYVVLYKE